MRRKRIVSFLATLVVLLIFLIALVRPAAANPYDLYGNGNCAYFCWDMMDQHWPAAFKVDREWDAAEWIRLNGQTSGEYQAQITDFEDPQCGDFLVWPRSSRWPMGHVSYVLLVDGATATVAESSNYANGGDYPLVLDGCRYRVKVYDYSRLELGGVKILKCIKREEVICLQTFPRTAGVPATLSGWLTWMLLPGFPMGLLSPVIQ